MASFGEQGGGRMTPNCDTEHPAYAHLHEVLFKKEIIHTHMFQFKQYRLEEEVWLSEGKVAGPRKKILQATKMTLSYP